MALLLHDFLQPQGEFAIWEIEEHTLELFEKLELTEDEIAESSRMSDSRKKECRISISHSQDKVAVIASPFNVGIDIQKLVEKMRRLSVKFLGTTEAEWDNSLEDLHVIWGAKEAMYKAWGKRGIDFARDMQVHKFQWIGDRLETTGYLNHKSITMHFNIRALQKDGFILVYAIEKQRVITQ